MLIESEEGATEAPMAQMSTQPSLVSRKWVGTRSVFPAKAGIQLTLLWVPAFAGKTNLGGCRAISPLQSYLQGSTLTEEGLPARRFLRGCAFGAGLRVRDGVGGDGPSEYQLTCYQGHYSGRRS